MHFKARFTLTLSNAVDASGAYCSRNLVYHSSLYGAYSSKIIMVLYIKLCRCPLCLAIQCKCEPGLSWSISFQSNVNCRCSELGNMYCNVPWIHFVVKILVLLTRVLFLKEVWILCNLHIPVEHTIWWIWSDRKSVYQCLGLQWPRKMNTICIHSPYIMLQCRL